MTAGARPRRFAPTAARFFPLAAALLATGCASLASPPDPALAPEFVPLRDRCARLMTPAFVAELREVAPLVVLARDDREIRRVLAPLARSFWWRLLRIERRGRVITFDVTLPRYVETAVGVFDATDDYRALRLVDSSSGRHDPRDWERDDSAFENVWIHQVNYPEDASFPGGRPTVLFQCWAGTLKRPAPRP